MASTNTNGIAPKRGLVGLLGRTPSRTDTSGIPFHELIGRALADASGEEYQPPAVAELEDLLGSDSFKQLRENPRIKQAVQVWANSSAEDRAAVTKSLATLIADEVGQPSLEKRIAWEIRKLNDRHAASP